MNDNLKRYLAIVAALKQLYTSFPNGNFLRHLLTLAALINGIVAAGKTQLPAIANKMPGDKLRESRIQQFRRWLKNTNVDAKSYFLPFLPALLAGLPGGPLVLIEDGSEVGRGCLTLMLSVVYQKRSLPLAWLVVKGKKGHFPQEVHKALLQSLLSVLPAQREIIFLGDGEFDGCELLKFIREQGWHFVCRTAKNVLLFESENTEHLWQEEEAFRFTDLMIAPGELLHYKVGFTAQKYYPVTAIGVWEAGNKEPLYLVTSIELAAEAVEWYRQRFRIETFFSDQKSRGFHLNKSHLTCPERLSRLLIACCLAYIWIVFLGAAVASRTSLRRQVHRRMRCDLSLFQLGIAWLERCLNCLWEIPVSFTRRPMISLPESVR